MADTDNNDEIHFISRGRYVSIEGNFIESCAKNTNIILPAHMVQNRIERDGLQEHHLTFINPFELKDAAIKLDIKKKAASRIIDTFTASMVLLILGSHPSISVLAEFWVKTMRSPCTKSYTGLQDRSYARTSDLVLLSSMSLLVLIHRIFTNIKGPDHLIL
ncbi:unnamed protein product [Umbelopsis ramanniana]